MRQCGARVDDVELPRWAPDARLFTLLHRQALEAPHVAEHLPAWIDLVFGYKQTGQPAIDAINVFPACVSTHAHTRTYARAYCRIPTVCVSTHARP